MPLNFLWVIHSEVGDKNFNLFILRSRILPGVLQGFTWPEEGRGKQGRNDSSWQGQMVMEILWKVWETLLFISCVSSCHLTALYLFLGTSQTNPTPLCASRSLRTCHPFLQFLAWSPLICIVRGQPFFEKCIFLYSRSRNCYTEGMINASYS